MVGILRKFVSNYDLIEHLAFFHKPKSLEFLWKAELPLTVREIPYFSLGSLFS